MKATTAVRRSVENIDIARIFEEIADLPGIGSDLAGKICTILQTGTLPLLQELTANMPESLVQMLTIPGVGPKRAKQIYDTLGITTLEALVRRSVHHHRRRLARLAAFRPVAATRLAAAIEKARRVDLARFLFALGIPDVGTATARRLAERFRTLAALRRATAMQLAAPPEVGPATARQMVEFFTRPRSAPGSKLDRANTLGVPVISEREFLRRYQTLRRARGKRSAS